MREHDGQRHAFLGLVGGIAEHETLIARTDVLVGLLLVHGLRDVRRLLFDGDEHVHRFVIETLI